MASVCIKAARVRFTTEAIWCALRSMRGSYSCVRSNCNQAKALQQISRASRAKVRQNRLRPVLRSAWGSAMTLEPLLFSHSLRG